MAENEDPLDQLPPLPLFVMLDDQRALQPVEENGCKSIIAFTTREAANAFLDSASEQGADLLMADIDSPATLRLILEDAWHADIDQIVIDLGSADTIAVDVERVLERLRLDGE